MGAVGTLTTLVLLGAFLVLTCVDTEVVILGEGFGADIALKRAWSIEEVDVLVEADIIFLGGAVVALGALVGLLSCMGAHVDAHFGLVSEQLGAYGTAGGLGAFDRHCSAGAVGDVGAEVVFIDQVDAEGPVGGVADGATVAAVNSGYGAELDVIRSFVTASKTGVAKRARIRWWAR